jgi:hypothetical protein
MITRAWSNVIDPAANACRVPANEPVLAELGGEPGRRGAPAAGLPGLLGEPGGGRGRPRLGPYLVALRGGEHPQVQLGDPGLDPVQHHQRLALFGGGHRPEPRLAQPVQRVLDRPREPEHRMHSHTGSGTSRASHTGSAASRGSHTGGGCGVPVRVVR